MHVLVLGVTGLIGSSVSAQLQSKGHYVTGLARHVPDVALYASRVVAADISTLRTEADWLPYLSGINAVVNCAGILQDSPSDSTAGVHNEGVHALFRACESADIKRVVHLSAIGVDWMTPTDFSRTKLRGDESLMALDLDWIILRPSVVVGRPAYGGSALFRGLAALSLLPQPQGTGPLQIVQLDELVSTIEFFLNEGAPSKVALDIAGPERLSLADIVLQYRGWLGWKPPRIVNMPQWLSSLTYSLGDLAGFFGWRPPMRTTASIEIQAWCYRRQRVLEDVDRNRATFARRCATCGTVFGAGEMVFPPLFFEAAGLRRVRAVLDHDRTYLVWPRLENRHGADARGRG
jgi:uncharacterized protein YbjT (DUF2867 family)